MPFFTLPNGLGVHAQNDIDVQSLYEEIFVQKSYLRHGIEVSDKDCIFDAGANIGLFSAYLGQQYRGLRILAFEPVPQTFSFLQKNVALHLTGSTVKLLNYGLSDRNGSARFECDRFMSPTATMYPTEISKCIREGTGMHDWVNAGLADLPRISNWSAKKTARVQKLMKTPFLGKLASFAIFLGFLAALVQKRLFIQHWDCELKTVSEVIREHSVSVIDLMKIDVEGSELDIINGIAEDDWSKIRQFVVEVHDMDGRVERMKDIFQSRGYTTTVDQLDFEVLKLLKNYTIYATRAEPSPAGA